MHPSHTYAGSGGINTVGYGASVSSRLALFLFQYSYQHTHTKWYAPTSYTRYPRNRNVRLRNVRYFGTREGHTQNISIRRIRYLGTRGPTRSGGLPVGRELQPGERGHVSWTQWKGGSSGGGCHLGQGGGTDVQHTVR